MAMIDPFPEIVPDIMAIYTVFMKPSARRKLTAFIPDSRLHD
jgi:hypothetical protein